MAWTVVVHLDEDKDDVGTVAATWNEGQADAFTYRRRAVASAGAAVRFKEEAEEALADKQARTVREGQLSTVLANIMNGA